MAASLSSEWGDVWDSFGDGGREVVEITIDGKAIQVPVCADNCNAIVYMLRDMLISDITGEATIGNTRAAYDEQEIKFNSLGRGDHSMTTEKLYSPLEFYLHNPREEEENGEYGHYDLYDEQYKISHGEAFEHMDAIELAIRRDRDRMDKTRGMAEYVSESLDGLVISVVPNVELHGGKLWCVADISLSRAITPGEMGELEQWWSGQLSDGWGEGFEQHEIRVGGGDELYVVPWNSGEDFFLETQREFYARLGLEPPEPRRETVPETPAQKALNEPGIFDGDIDCVDTSVYMTMLTNRVNANFIDYIDTLRGIGADDITDHSAEIATMAEAHYYITQRHNFHFSELDYLLKFQNPLLVVTEAFDANRDEEHSDIMWNIFHGQDALRNGRHPLAADTPEEPGAPDADALKQELFDRLDANMSDYRKGMMGASKEDIFDMAEDIASRYAAREYMKTSYDFKTGEVEFLLQFQDPLSLVAEGWPGMADAPVDIPDIIEVRGTHGHYAKVMDADHPASKESARSGADMEKPSVLERIREAARTPKEPRKEKPARDRSGPEL
jgi:hypothetical protein